MKTTSPVVIIALNLLFSRPLFVAPEAFLMFDITWVYPLQSGKIIKKDERNITQEPSVTKQ